MPFDKPIQLCKEHRKQYRGSAVFDRSCRNHGNYDWCKDDRTFHDQKHRFAADDQIKEESMVLDLEKDLKQYLDTTNESN